MGVQKLNSLRLKKADLAFTLSQHLLGDRWVRHDVIRQSGLSDAQCRAVLENRVDELDEFILSQAVDRCEGRLAPPTEHAA